MLMYIGIFAGIIFGFILPNSGKTEDEYKSMKCKFAWFDYDQTAESEVLFSYLDHAHKHAELKTDTTEAMQDSLFNRNTDCIVRIKKGYADHLDKEDLSDYIEIVAIPNRSKVELFESDVNKYISYLNAYFVAGYDRAEAAAQVNELFQTRTNVTMTTEDHGGKHSTRYTFFSYLGWIFVVARLVLFSHNGDVMICPVNCRTHQVDCTGIHTDILFIGVFLMDCFRHEAAVRC